MPAVSKKIRYWVDVALECVRRDHTPAFGSGDQRGPFLTARALGMALGALHDGYVLAGGGGTTLLSLPPLGAPPGLDTSVAGAAAGHQLLLHRYPAQTFTLNLAWDFWVRLFMVASPAMGPSEHFGRKVGDAVHLLGLDDRQLGSALDYEPHGPYTHNRPPHEPGQSFAGSRWGIASQLVTIPVTDFPNHPAGSMRLRLFRMRTLLPISRRSRTRVR